MADPAQHLAANLRVTLIGVTVNIFLAAGKLIAGVVGHSQALVADAVESFADILGSLVIWQGLRVAARPPDEDHPYGHGKAEAVAALAVGLMLVFAGVGIVVQAARHIAEPDRLPEPFTLWVLVGVIIIKELLFQLARARAKASGSSALLADAWHHRSDAVTSIAALIGIALSLYAGPAFRHADPIAAIVAAGVIVFNALRIMRPPLSELLDAHQPELQAQVREIARSVPGVVDVEKVLARKSGGMFHVDMHLHVAPDMPVRDAHALGGKVKAIIREKVPSVRNVLMHVEPSGEQATREVGGQATNGKDVK
ncbi:MAG: cation diffusion facilitator family transporter [Phycisphaerales bacterium]